MVATTEMRHIPRLIRMRADKLASLDDTFDHMYRVEEHTIPGTKKRCPASRTLRGIPKGILGRVLLPCDSCGRELETVVTLYDEPEED